jgi:Na+/H+-dicarboxylate symporter/ABC-type amino acid transport substrate-binding protein
MGKISLGYQVLIAVLLGIAVGLFFGPLTIALKPIGDTYTMLLQMAVLPYICFSLIHGLGSLSPATGKKLFRSGWPYLLALWGMIFAIIFFLQELIPTTHPPLIKVDEAEQFESSFTKNFLTYLVPQNPIYDIVNNIVPAVAVFGLIGGIALMQIEKKEPLIGVIERVNKTIEKVLQWLGFLSPLGAFVYISIGFGTIHFEDLDTIGVYVIAFIAASLIITLWLLPTLLSALTPLSFKEASRSIRYVCLLPFVTGLPTTALPFLNIYLKKLAQKHETHEHFRETSQTVLPIAYSFGNIGNAMTLFFVTFLSFYYRHPFVGAEKPLLYLMTLPLSIGTSMSNVNSIQFLIEQLGFPQSAFDFFLQIKSITYNFQVLMSVASILTLLVLTLYAYYGLVHIRLRPLCLKFGLFFAALAAVVFSLKPIIYLKDNYQNLYMKLRVTDVMPNRVQATIYPNSDEMQGVERVPTDDFYPDTLKTVLKSSTLKVGFDPDAIPFSYFNEKNELVGYDICYAYQFALDLDCKLEFIPFKIEKLGDDLRARIFDLGMGSIIMSEKRLLEMDFTTPYAQDNNVLIVPVAKKRDYYNLQNVIARKGLRLQAAGAQVPIAERHFPNATIVNLEDMSLIQRGEVDAVMWSYTSSFIWCLTHPEFVAIDYGLRIGKCYFSYAMPQHSIDFRFFLNNCLSLKEQSGFKQKMQAYWIEGLSPPNRPPRWSILHNVLHWVN